MGESQGGGCGRCHGFWNQLCSSPVIQGTQVLKELFSGYFITLHYLNVLTWAVLVEHFKRVSKQTVYPVFIKSSREY